MSAPRETDLAHIPATEPMDRLVSEMFHQIMIYESALRSLGRACEAICALGDEMNAEVRELVRRRYRECLPDDPEPEQAFAHLVDLIQANRVLFRVFHPDP